MMMGPPGPHRHLLHGLVVESPVWLPAATTASSPPDLVITVRVGRLPRPGPDLLAHVETAQRRHTCWRAGDAAQLLLPGALHAELPRSGDELRVAITADLDPGLLSVLTAASLVRGRPLLHASAVASAGAALALVGPSGAGKSSLARLLTDDGAALLSDDVLRVDWEDDVPLARAGTSSSRLRSNSLVGCREATTSADGRIVVVDGVAAPDPVSLRAVLAPLLSPAYREVRVIRHPSRAALFVLAAAHPLDGLLGLDLLADHFEHAARIAGAAPVLRVEVPWPGRANAGLASCIRRLVDTELEMFEPDTFEPDTCGPDGTGLQSASVDRG